MATEKKSKVDAPYRHEEATLLNRPAIGASAHFKKKKPDAEYRYDSSLAPELLWDEQPARERGEALIARIQHATTLEDAQAAANELARMSRPFLNWTGKAERPAFSIPTLPLYIHERLSTQAILATLRKHRRDKQETFFDQLFGGADRPLVESAAHAYEYPDKWENRLILGDSLQVMNSLIEYDQLGGQVQMVYMDPPYGVKFGSNFQPFVRKRDVSHNDDDDFTREPEMVQAYRDTWELGLHSYLTYLRDRLKAARELLTPSGSVFVQISDENLHHVREVMDEVFGAENFVSLVAFKKTTTASTDLLATVSDFLLWYAKDHELLKFRPVFLKKDVEPDAIYRYVRLQDGTERPLQPDDMTHPERLDGARFFALDNLTSPRPAGAGDLREYSFNGKTFVLRKGTFKTDQKGLDGLAAADRLGVSGDTLRYKRFIDDFPVKPVTNVWTDTSTGSFTEDKIYAVQTATKAVERCILMATDPGDLVFDPTCGSGTTAFVAEQWGRRWITCDTSRVPLALARQRVLTATFDFFELKDSSRGPVGGFVYKRKQNQRGEEIGGIVPHITLRSVANSETPPTETLVDRPEIAKNVVRVTGPFCVESTLPPADNLDEQHADPDDESAERQHHVEQMLQVLRHSPVLRLDGNKTLTLKQVRQPNKTLFLSAEAVVDRPTLGNLADDASAQPSLVRDVDAVAILFGPKAGPVTERLVREAWQEADTRKYSQLLVIGFAIDARARQFIDSAAKLGIPCAYLQATMDLQMGDLLKNMRSSQVFSVCGLPDVEVKSLPPEPGSKDKELRWEVTLRGLDTFNPIDVADPGHLQGEEVPAWFLDTDYNDMVFHVRQAFFPRTGAWESLKRSLRAEFDESVWTHLSGTTSEPFTAGVHRRIAVKAIDPRGNELMVVRELRMK